ESNPIVCHVRTAVQGRKGTPLTVLIRAARSGSVAPAPAVGAAGAALPAGAGGGWSGRCERGGEPPLPGLLLAEAVLADGRAHAGRPDLPRKAVGRSPKC